MLDLEIYGQMMEFLSLYLGKNSEIILCDTKNILLVQNPFNETTKPGAPLAEMQQVMLQNPDFKDIKHNINYRSLSSIGEKMRSATLFIQKDGELQGLLTINMNVNEWVRMRSLMDNLINGDQEFNYLKPQKKSVQSYETLSLNMSEIINKVLEEAIIRFDAPISRLKSSERLSIIREMDSRGVFLTKGSVNEVAEKLFISKATIYRYLQQLEK